MVRVPNDSGKHVAVYLEPRTGKRHPRSAFNMADLASRMASRMKTTSTLYSSDDLADMGIVWVGDAIQGAVTRTSGKTYHADDDCFAVLNGGPEIVSLKGLTREDIVSLEIYTDAGGSTAPPMKTVQKSSFVPRGRMLGTQITGLSNTGAARDANFYTGRRCPVIYVWKR